MKKLIVIISALTIGFFHELRAQDTHFSQYDKMPLALNPALAGLNFKTQGNIMYRSQWTSVETPFNTIGASFDQRINAKSGNSFFGVGVSGISDNAAARTVNSLDIKLTGSGHIKLDRLSTLGIGIQAGFLQKSLNANNFQWGTQYDGSGYNDAIIQAEGGAYNVIKALDASAGIVYSYNVSDFLRVLGNNDIQFSTGFMASHINRPKNSFNGSNERLPMKYSFFANSLISVSNSNLSVGPSVLFQSQGNFRELVLGTKFRVLLQPASKFTGFRNASAASFGVFFRNKDALIAMLQYEVSNYSIGMSYDLNISKLNPYSNLRGGYEITFRYAAPNPFGSSKARI